MLRYFLAKMLHIVFDFFAVRLKKALPFDLFLIIILIVKCTKFLITEGI